VAAYQRLRPRDHRDRHNTTTTTTNNNNNNNNNNKGLSSA